MFLLGSDLLFIFILVFLFVQLVFFHYLMILISEELDWLYMLLKRSFCFSGSPLAFIGVGWYTDQEWEVGGNQIDEPVSHSWVLYLPTQSQAFIQLLQEKGLCFSTRYWLYMFCKVSNSALVCVLRGSASSLSSRKWPAFKQTISLSCSHYYYVIPLWISLLLRL